MVVSWRPAGRHLSAPESQHLRKPRGRAGCGSWRRGCRPTAGHLRRPTRDLTAGRGLTPSRRTARSSPPLRRPWALESDERRTGTGTRRPRCRGRGDGHCRVRSTPRVTLAGELQCELGIDPRQGKDEEAACAEGVTGLPNLKTQLRSEALGVSVGSSSRPSSTASATASSLSGRPGRELSRFRSRPCGAASAGNFVSAR